MSVALDTADLEYDLPGSSVATRPHDPRDGARMLVWRLEQDAIEHASIRDFPSHLDPSDLLVRNISRVIPARLVGHRDGTRGRVEGLFLEEREDGSWRVMLRSNGTLRPGHRIRFGALTLNLLGRAGADWLVQPNRPERADKILEEVGRTPLPPYIRSARARSDSDPEDPRDRTWYQAVYADRGHPGSIAAPTAGLHFTEDLLNTVTARGIPIIDLVLHVGPGTFRPIETHRLEEHALDPERWEIEPEALTRLAEREASSERGRLVAVGTTCVRTLESLPVHLPEEGGMPLSGSTDLFISPPYEFRRVEGMLTNFHLPRSSLLALVAAMTGLSPLLRVYREAIDRGYRFFSYGDAMLILP